jgi:hypothetical protein
VRQPRLLLKALKRDLPTSPDTRIGEIARRGAAETLVHADSWRVILKIWRPKLPAPTLNLMTSHRTFRA